MQQHRTLLSGSVLFLSEKAFLYFFAGGDRPVPDDILWCNTILRLKPHNLSGLICVKLRCPICLASAKLHPPSCFTQIILGNLCELIIKD